MKVAFLGLGAMGWPMAKNLKEAGFEVLVWNRTEAKARAHAERFGTRAVALEETSEAEILFTCLPTSSEVAAIAERLAGQLREGTVWVDCTSGDPSQSRAIAEALAEHGVAFLDAPVSGGTQGAEAGTLTIMVGGDPEAFERALPALNAIGERIVHVGPVGAGHAVKAVNNTLLALNLLAAAEGLATLVKEGVRGEVALEVINASSGRSFASADLIPNRVLDRSFPLTFKLGLLAKDVRIGARVAEAAGVPALAFHLAREVYEIARRTLGNDADHVEVVKLIEEWAGTEIR